MLKSSESIVFKCINFRETSIIAHVLTPDQGIVPLIVSGVRTKKNKGKAAQFQIGQLLDVVFYDKQKEGVMRLKESQLSTHYKTIPFLITKIALTQYFVEVTRNCIYQSGIQSDGVFELLKSSLLHLDEAKGAHTNLAIYYLWNLIDCLGLSPNLDYIQGEYLDLESGDFCQVLPSHQRALTIDLVRKLQEVKDTKLDHLDLLDLGGRERKMLLESGHQYLKFHLSYFKLPKSADIFREILKL